MHRLLPRASSTAAVAALVGAALLPACGDKKGAGPSTSSTSPASGGASAAPAVAGPESPLAVAIEARAPLLLASLQGGVVITDAAHTRWGHAAAGGPLTAVPMPGGLPEGPGRIVGAAGRLPSPVWLVYETLREDGKVDKNPLFRLGKEGFKKFADDWRPLMVPWTKHRILAASTSSGRLKIKVIEPSLPAPPDDLPSAQLGDASCDKTLKVQGLAALPSGEVFAAGVCKPDTAAGAGPSPIRYVVIRWAPGATARSAPDGGADAGGEGADGGAGGPPGVVDVIPGVSGHLVHEALWARDPGDVWAAAHDPSGKPPGASKLFHFDGATWGAVAAPEGTAFVRGLAGTADGTVWLATEKALFRRTASGAWDPVPLPSRGFAGEGAWEMADLAAPDGRDVWISARWTPAGAAAPTGARHVILTTRASPEALRWD